MTALAGAAAAPAAFAAPAAAAVAEQSVQYWYLKDGHWYWTSHWDKYQAHLAAGGVGNGTAGPDLTLGADQTATAPASPSGGGGSRATEQVRYWYLKGGHWYWTSHWDKYQAHLAAGGVGNGTAGPDLDRSAAPQGGDAATGASATEAEKPVRYWYFKGNHWYWTSHWSKYQAHLAAGGLGNGTTFPGLRPDGNEDGPWDGGGGQGGGVGGGPGGGGGGSTDDDTEVSSFSVTALPGQGGTDSGSTPTNPASTTTSPTATTTTTTQTSTDATEDGAPGLTTEQAEQVVAYAYAALGKPYMWGGDGPEGYDCSGLVQQAYLSAGHYLPRVANEQAAATIRIERSELRPGDLVFWSTDGSERGVHHVAIYIGDDRYIEAPRPGKKVRISSLDNGYTPSFYGRVP
ncbi:C40 family peptidase [Allostreptomyces psammosilenae]|uniref:Cell wall-associated NlpC family hydrolase n=1 Tax=Allostreptomyces psammosilenae TaxID=1892865 RepID=A0A853A466_9ACTN|nr:C40 family peptidase [Allostreptomyces psammosilenae]NYI05288.1 cell wall-associated NlpC family hydrolase [Allostreptomyces psammosilenae]